MEATVWIWNLLLKVGSVTSAGGAEDGRTRCLCLCLGPFLSLVPGRCSSPCGPPHPSRPASGRPRCAASAPLSTAPSLCPSLSPSPHGMAGLYPRPWRSSVGVWSWTGRLEEQRVGGEATGSRKLAGKSPLKETKHKTCESKKHKTHTHSSTTLTQTVETDEGLEQNPRNAPHRQR